jgi:hypothetical protein
MTKSLAVEFWDTNWARIVADKRLRLPQSDRYVWITGFTACEEVLGDHTFSSSLLGHGQDFERQNLLFMDAPGHGELRAKLTRALPKPQSIEAPFSEQVDRIVSGLAGKSRFDLVADLSSPIAGSASCILMGVPEVDHPRVITLLTRIASRFDPTIPSETRQGGDLSALALMHYFFRLFKKKSYGDGVFQRLVAQHMSSRISLDELLVSSVVLSHASFENSCNFLSYAIAEVLTNTRVRTALDSTSESVRRRCLEELTRLGAPARLLTRRATADHSVDSTMIRRGDYVLAAVAEANRDPNEFDRPDEISGEPVDRRNLTFGSGEHRCPGALLARREAEIALRTIASLCSRPFELIDSEWKDNAMMFGPRHIEIRSQS